MPIIEDERTILNLIKLTSSGLSVATFPQIKETLIEKYKEIYGSDIDLTNTTADGIFIENMSLIISNILQAFNFLYSNLDIRTAQGSYLESLCALTGIYRKSATQSVAYISITNKDDTPIVLQGGLLGTQLSFIDNSSLEWTTCVGDITHSPATQVITLEKDVPQIVPIYCKNYGPVQAKKGWINTLTSANYNIEFEQLEDAIIGSNIENDAQLRRRRNEVISSSGLTVLSTLKGALLNIGGVQEVKLYNNNTGETIVALDNTYVLPGSVYIIIKQSQEIDNSIIGPVIYEKMTPGIKACESSGVCGTNKEYISNEEQNPLLINKVNWKLVSKIGSGLTITASLIKYNTFDINTFRDNLIAYLNDLNIGKDFTTYEMITELSSADLNTNNTRTFVMNSIDLDSDDVIETTFTDYKQYNTKDTCFNLSNDCSITETTIGNITTIVLTWS